jgi:putative ABC transport system permease protein
MNIWNSITIGLKNIWAYKFRSILTMLGLVLGVSSLVAISAIVNGMEDSLREPLIAAGGVDKVWINQTGVPPHQEHLREFARGLTFKDVRALQEGASLVRLVAPSIGLRGVVMTRNGKRAVPSGCWGAWPSHFELSLNTLEHGRFFTDLDEEFCHSVCIIGTGVRNALFGSPMELGREVIPLGEKININGQPFTIVGMSKHYERERARLAREKAIANGTWTKEREAASLSRSSRGYSFWGKNNGVYMPVNTMKVKLKGDYHEGRPDKGLTQIGFKVFDATRVEEAMQQVRSVLLRTHDGIEDFNFNYFVGRWRDDIETRTRDARVSGGMIAGMSLLVGGIGIMNIMFASINERLREIGTCKAIGATPFSIFVQFLVEATVLAIIGTIGGIAASYLLLDLLTWATSGQIAVGNSSSDSVGNAPMITSSSMLLAAVFGLTVGVLAGLFPAVKAAGLSPIEALRSE